VRTIFLILLSGYVNVLLGNGNGSFGNQITYSIGTSPYSVAVGDFNKDTRLDIVVANSGDSNIGILLGYGNGSFASQMTYSTGTFPFSVAVGDFNGDAQLDIAVTNMYSLGINVFLGYGNGSFANQSTYSSGLALHVAIGDFNNDTRLDIVVANTNDNNVGVFLGYANLVFVNKMTLRTGDGSRPRSFATGDFNNDDRMDIVVVNSGINNLDIFLGYGNYSFAKQKTYSTDDYPLSVAVHDINNDTQLDIVVVNSLSNNVGVYIGYGNGSFSSQNTLTTGSSSQPYAVALVDFDNDTIIDIIVANYGSNDVGVLRGLGNGIFAVPMMFSNGYGSHPFSVVIGDFNNDRKVDFAVANDGFDNLNILLQTC
jgi:hypothetical protein